MSFDREEYILKYAISVDRIIRGAEAGVASRAIKAKALVKAGKTRKAEQLALETNDQLLRIRGRFPLGSGTRDKIRGTALGDVGSAWDKIYPR
jgi:hypothetical protein